MNINSFSQLITVFQERLAPEEGYLAGYAAIHRAYNLVTPLPDVLALISQKHKQYKTDDWMVFTPRYKPEDTLKGHLTFALKYEGIDLGLLKKLFEQLDSREISSWVEEESTSQYSRKIWFLYEWLMGTQLKIPDLTTGNSSR
jgi:hypothetical protein